MAAEKIKPTPERVARMLQGERARLARLEREVAETQERIARLEAATKK